MGDDFYQAEVLQAQRKSEYSAIAFEAISVAMRAKTGGKTGRAGRPDTNALTVDAVDSLRARAEQVLEHGDALRRAILNFATMYELHHRSPDDVVQLGRALHDGVMRIIAPPAPQSTFRADIDG